MPGESFMEQYREEDIERGKRRLADIKRYIGWIPNLSNTSNVLGRIENLVNFLADKKMTPEIIGTTQAELDDLRHQVYIGATKRWLDSSRERGLKDCLGLLADNFLLSGESLEYYGITEPEIIKEIEYRRSHPPIILKAQFQ